MKHIGMDCDTIFSRNEVHFRMDIFRMKSYQVFFTIFLFINLSVGLSGCAMDEPRLPALFEAGESQTPTVLIDSYKMSMGDQIQILVWKNPELSLSEPVRPDGKISVPLVGDVMAVGLTPEELAEVIEGQFVDNTHIAMTDEQIGQITRARLSGLKKVDDAFKQIAQFKTVKESKVLANPAR